MGKFIDLTGQRFGRLEVKNIDCQKRIGKKLYTFWNCLCDCGKTKSINGHALKAGKSQSCGCLKIELLKEYENIVGQKFGRWEVIKEVEKPDNIKGRNKYWLCKCECGKKRIVKGDSLKSGTSTSCGCYIAELTRNRTKYEYGLASVLNVYRMYKRNSKKAGRIFELSLDFFKLITQKRCIHCGSEPNNIMKNYHNNGDYVYNGIDRINSDLGYTEDNVVPCCWHCNQAKSDYTLEEHDSWLEQSYFYKQQNKIEDFCI
jgi:hypothetical protein